MQQIDLVDEDLGRKETTQHRFNGQISRDRNLGRNHKMKITCSFYREETTSY